MTDENSAAALRTERLENSPGNVSGTICHINLVILKMNHAI
jgi:hypothetical protein